MLRRLLPASHLLQVRLAPCHCRVGSLRVLSQVVHSLGHVLQALFYHRRLVVCSLALPYLGLQLSRRACPVSIKMSMAGVANLPHFQLCLRLALHGEILLAAPYPAYPAALLPTSYHQAVFPLFCLLAQQQLCRRSVAPMRLLWRFLSRHLLARTLARPLARLRAACHPFRFSFCVSKVSKLELCRGGERCYEYLSIIHNDR